MHVGLYLQMVKVTEEELEEAFKTVAEHHHQEPDLKEICCVWDRRNRSLGWTAGP